MALPQLKSAKAMKASKGAKASKAMKVVKKAKRVTKVARGRLARALVMRGKYEKTVGGLKREALMKNKRGKIVSKRASAAGKRAFLRIEGWVEAVVTARKALAIDGFVAINGRTLQGKALYAKTKALYGPRRAGTAGAVASSPARTTAASTSAPESA